MGSPFPNDGSFLERFKLLQQGQVSPESVKTNDPVLKGSIASNSPSSFQSTPAASQGATGKGAALANGKLAFSLKQKSRLSVNALKLGSDEEEVEEMGSQDADRQGKRLKTEKAPSSVLADFKDSVPPPPSDLEVRKVADKLASFVAKNGRQFENITRQKNPGDTPFRFLFDLEGADYKYYEYCIAEEELALASKSHDLQPFPTVSEGSIASRQQSSQPKRGAQHQTRYHTPTSALYSNGADGRRRPSRHSSSSQDYSRENHQSFANDSVAMMEFYMKKAAQEDLCKPSKHSKDEMPPPPSLHTSPPRSSRESSVIGPSEESAQEGGLHYQSPTKGVVEDAAQAVGKKGHHMGDYIPPEELEKFLAKCNNAMAAKAAKATADRAKIQADNVGHRLLSKMGWKEGEGLGSGRSGRADPVVAGTVKLNNLGVGAEQPGEVTADDDIYEQYKKRMMLGYRFRPNPLNNPRKAYY